MIHAETSSTREKAGGINPAARFGTTVYLKGLFPRNELPGRGVIDQS